MKDIYRYDWKQNKWQMIFEMSQYSESPKVSNSHYAAIAEGFKELSLAKTVKGFKNACLNVD